MVKRVKNLAQQPTDDSIQVDSTKLVKEVEESSQIAQLSEETVEAVSKPRRPVPAIKRGKMSCPLCEQRIKPKEIVYYDIALLKKFTSLRGKILPRSKTGLCTTHQRAVVRAIKMARQVALLPYLTTGAE